MSDNIIIRRATIDDKEFLVDTIVAAEKSGTDNFGLAKFFELSEDEMRIYIKKMLEEDIEGCEFSVSSFIVADINGAAIAAFAGWFEGHNENNLPSAILKSNLIRYHIPLDNIKQSQTKADIITALQIERDYGTYQLEYSYVLPKYQGKGILGRIIEAHEQEAISIGARKIQVHVFANNFSAIRSYKKKGFTESQYHESSHPMTVLIFPSNIKILMEKDL